jgi:hypothetical protein
MGILKACMLFLRAIRIPKAHLVVENLTLRQQLAVLGQSVKRQKLRPHDRVFWVWLWRLWPNWRSALAIVHPETVIKWLSFPKTPSGNCTSRPDTLRIE